MSMHIHRPQRRRVWVKYYIGGHRALTSMHIHRTQERRLGVRYYVGGHRALTDVSPASQAIRYRTPISNGEASGCASHAEGGNVGQAPVAYS